MVKLVLSLLALWIAPACAFAQTCTLQLKVQLRDLDDNGELSFAVVKVIGSDKILQSDAHGEFSLSGLCAGTQQFLVQHFDCRDTIITVELTRSSKLLVRLPHSVNQLKEVDVMDKRAEMRKTQAQVTLNSDAIMAGKGQPLAELLKNVSGVTTLNTGATISRPMLHGMQGNRLLILNNGVRQEGQQWGSEHAPEIDPFMAKKIAVIKGVAAIRYGSDAIAGVVLAEQDELPDTAALTGELSLVGLSNGRTGAAAMRLQGYFDALRYFSWRIQGSVKKGGNVRTPGYYLTNTGMQEHNFSYAMGYHRKKWGTELYYSQFNTTIGIYRGSHIGNITDLQQALRYGKPTDSASAFSYAIGRPDQQVAHELVKWASHYHFSPRWRSSFHYAWQHNIRQEYDLRRLTAAERASGFAAPDLDLRVTSQTAEAIIEHDNIRSFRGMLGLSGMYQENTSQGRFFIPNYVNTTWGVFATERYVLPHVELEAGIRYDQKLLRSYYFVDKVWTISRRNFDNINANGGMIWKADSTFNLFVNAGTAWRSPAPNELYANGIHQGVSAIERGDSTLKLEKCYNLTVSGIYRTQKLRAEVTVYHNEFSNFIYLQPSGTLEVTIRGAFPVFNYQQANARISGVDLNAEYQLQRQLLLLFKGMVVRGWNRAISDYLIYMPADRAEAGLKILLPDWRWLKNASVQASNMFVARQWRVPASGDFSPPPAGYYLGGLSLAGTVYLRQQPMELHFGINNLFNARYRDYLDRFRYYCDAQGVSYNLRLNFPIVIYDKKSHPER